MCPEGAENRTQVRTRNLNCLTTTVADHGWLDLSHCKQQLQGVYVSCNHGVRKKLN